MNRCSPDLWTFNKDGQDIRSAVTELTHRTVVSYLQTAAKATLDASLVARLVQELARTSGKHLSDEEWLSLYTAVDDVKVPRMPRPPSRLKGFPSMTSFSATT